MPFPILGGKAITDVTFSVANSARWNRADTPYMHQTFSGAGNRDKWTFSCWVKKCSNGVEQRLLTTSDNSTFDDNIRFESDDKFMIICNNTEVLKTNRVFRDNSAFYHICVIWDSGNGTSGDRVQLWVNGTRETSFGTEAYPSADVDSHINNATPHYIGVTNATADSHHLHGYLAEVVFQNDNADSPVDKFGQFNEDSPTIWEPIDVSGLTLGTNGTYLDFEDSSNLGNDVGGGTDWTEVNFAATDQATDTPTNSFCTLNPLVPSAQFTFSEGNCKMVSSGSDNTGGGIGTFGVGAGKWFWEVKMASLLGNHTHGVISELTPELYQNVAALQNDTGVTQFRNDDGGEMNTDGTQTTADYGTLDDGDIMGIALNADDNQISIYDNGSAIVSNFALSSTRGNFLFPYIGSGINTTFETNFGGCPAFTVSSANQDANGYGNFEYAVPSGYFSLCTKNLAEYG